MTAPLVTIAIPTYNRADSYLSGAIHAALGQSYANLEVLVADNCSTDDTPRLVEGIADPRLKYFRQGKNIGARNNMNFLLAKTTGEYFQLYADDDRIDSDFVEVCMAAINGRPATGLIMTGARVIDEKGAVLRQRESDPAVSSVEDLMLLWYQRKIHLFMCSTLFNTQMLREAGGFERKFGHFDDVAAEFKCAAKGGCVSIPAVKAGLREHALSITKSAGVAAWADSSLALLELAISLASLRRQEIAAVGHRISATRNYLLADALPSTINRWRAYFTVLRKFGYRQWPEAQAIKSLALTTLRAPFASRRAVRN
jgi:glycosyltransferase involved in cell wall biosynthesis